MIISDLFQAILDVRLELALTIVLSSLLLGAGFVLGQLSAKRRTKIQKKPKVPEWAPEWRKKEAAIEKRSKQKWWRTNTFLEGISTELFGAVITTLCFGVILVIFQQYSTIQNQKRDLILSMGSDERVIAVEAVRQMRVLGWLDNGALRGANLWGADLRETDLRGADLRETELRGADLTGANLRDADLGDANLWGADLRDANLRSADLRDTVLIKADLRGANLGRNNPSESLVTVTSPSGDVLSQINLWGADLRGADLRGPNQRGTFIYFIDPRGADLTGANLRGADLTGADLTGADLTGANLGRYDPFDTLPRDIILESNEPILTDTILRDADLTDADLTGAILPDNTPWTPDTDMTRFTNP